MIEFIKVQGDVLVIDYQTQYTMNATKGMTFNKPGDYKIITRPLSRATVIVNQQVIELRERSELKISPGCRNQISYLGNKIHSYVGRLMGRLTGRKITFDKNTPNAVAGVRG